MSIIKIRKPQGGTVTVSFAEMASIGRRFLPYARRHWLYFLAGIIATFVLNGATVVQPYILKVLADNVLNGPNTNFTTLNMCLLVLVGTGLIKGMFLYVQAYMMAFGNQATIRDLREDVYEHLQSLPVSWFDRSPLGDIIVRLTDDVRIVTELLAASLILLMNDTIACVASVGYMAFTSPFMTFLAFFLTPITAWVIDRIDKSIERHAVSSQERVSDLTSRLQETMSGIRVVKAFASEDAETDRYCQGSTEMYEVGLKMTRATLMQNPIVEVISSLSIVIVIGYGAYAVAHHILTLGEFMAFWGYLLLASTPISRITSTISNLRRGLVAARRVFEVKDISPEVKDAPGAVPLPPAQKEICFRDVQFSYNPDSPVLRGIDFSVPYGKVVAIVGPNGAGKSTMMALLARFYGPQSGAILIDDRDIATVTLRSLRDQIGFVLQDNYLFSGRLRDNLKYGRPDASDEEMFEAARVANCHDFIASLPEQYDTEVEEGGRGLSGGQRQKLAIARALISQPRILILDEATASLDLEAERDVQRGLHVLMEGRSTFVIAHRLSTIRRADLILVVEAGRIVEQGTHDELLALDGLFKRLHDSFYGLDAGMPDEVAVVS